jgi:hypothetical protein
MKKATSRGFEYELGDTAVTTRNLSVLGARLKKSRETKRDPTVAHRGRTRQPREQEMRERVRRWGEGGGRVPSAKLTVRRSLFPARSSAREPTAAKRGGFGTSVTPTDDLHRWPLFAEPATAAPTTATTNKAKAALEQSRPERWGRQMLGRCRHRAEEQTLRSG